MPQPTSGLPSETRPRAEPPETEPPGTGPSDRPAGPVPFTQAVRTDTLGDERTDMAAGKPVEPVEPVEPAAPGPDKPRAVRERTVGVLLEVLAAVVVVGVFLVW